MNALDTRKQIQGLLGVVQDGQIGPKSMAALQHLIATPDDSVWPPDPTIHEAMASSFADPADVAAFNRCKAQGKSDKECFKVGDNGIGQFGANTAQEETAMCALHKDDMIAEWGSVEASAHQPVEVTANGTTIRCTVEDRCGVPNRIDLNPGAAKQLGLTPPFLVPAQWRKV